MASSPVAKSYLKKKNVSQCILTNSGSSALVAYHKYILRNKIFLNGLNASNEAFRKLTTRQYMTETDTKMMETASKDLTHVNVYFTDTMVTQIEECPLYKPFGLVSNIGGGG